MAKKPKPNVEEEATRLADYIAGRLMEAHDNRALLQQAMEVLWGSAEAFYQEYFQHLSPAKRAKFGEVIDRLIEERQKEKLKIFHLLADAMVQASAHALTHAGVVQVDAEAPLLEPRAGTGKDAGYRKDQRRNR